MSESRASTQQVRPSLQFSLPCERVEFDAFHIPSFRTVSHTLAAVFPGGKPPHDEIYMGLRIVNCWTNGKGTFRQRVELYDSASALIHCTNEEEFTLAGWDKRYLAVDQITVPAREGTYRVVIRLDDEPVLEYSLQVQVAVSHSQSQLLKNTPPSQDQETDDA